MRNKRGARKEANLSPAVGSYYDVKTVHQTIRPEFLVSPLIGIFDSLTRRKLLDHLLTRRAMLPTWPEATSRGEEWSENFTPALIQIIWQVQAKHNDCPSLSRLLNLPSSENHHHHSGVRSAICLTSGEAPSVNQTNQRRISKIEELNSRARSGHVISMNYFLTVRPYKSNGNNGYPLPSCLSAIRPCFGSVAAIIYIYASWRLMCTGPEYRE
ncbi:hypothetical protein BJX68DRAFT_119923 [Aspergillus pseudodeflectus]|uniref:Uncharacterized protein n=1 Tax=Aspergillus pseudodeflectus TaxID=176178 RepID=A0ABR4K411_9EURO